MKLKIIENVLLNIYIYMFIYLKEQTLNTRVKENYPDISDDVYNRKFYTFYTKTIPVIDYYEKQGKLIKLNGNGEIHNLYSNLYKTITELQKEKLVKSNPNPDYIVKKQSSRHSSSSRVSSRRHSASSSRGSLSKRKSSKNLSRSKSKLNNGKDEFKNVFFVIGNYYFNITYIIFQQDIFKYFCFIILLCFNINYVFIFI